MNNRYDRKIDSEHFDPTLSNEKILMQIRQGSKVLECGCATGYMTRYMRDELGCDVSIVEYDADAYAIARQYASDGICADLMQTEWLNQFKGVQFDYILFADVLEHLYDPQAVLKSAVTLLKEDGSILASVPNIAHGDILLNLWKGNWNYTETGLLDRTHIRFFAENNLDSFFYGAGLTITRLDYTMRPVGRTEQVYDPCGMVSVESRLWSALKERESAAVYQFVIAAQPREYVERHHITQEKMQRKNQTTATLYYSLGEGFSEENAERVIYEAPDLNWRINWSGDSPKALRFDPLEGQDCIVTSFQAFSNEGVLKTVPLNGRRLGKTDIFVTEDPQYSVDIENKEIIWIEISAQIEVSPNGQIHSRIAQLMADCKELEEKCAVQSDQIQELEEKCTAQSDQIQKLEEKCAVQGDQVQELEEKCAAQNNRIQGILEEFQALREQSENLKQQNDSLEQQLVQAQNNYNVISNSFFWKITKPFRAILDALKSILK